MSGYDPAGRIERLQDAGLVPWVAWVSMVLGTIMLTLWISRHQLSVRRRIEELGHTYSLRSRRNGVGRLHHDGTFGYLAFHAKGWHAPRNGSVVFDIRWPRCVAPPTLRARFRLWRFLKKRLSDEGHASSVYLFRTRASITLPGFAIVDAESGIRAIDTVIPPLDAYFESVIKPEVERLHHSEEFWAPNAIERFLRLEK